MADDATAVMPIAYDPYGDSIEDEYACEYCGGEGLVYERLNVHEVADDFINDEYLMTLQEAM